MGSVKKQKKKILCHTYYLSFRYPDKIVNQNWFKGFKWKTKNTCYNNAEKIFPFQKNQFEQTVKDKNKKLYL